MQPDSPSPSPARRKTFPHGTPSWVDDEANFFITICCAARGANDLCTAQIYAALIESVEFRTARGDWFVHLFVLMPDHVHALISFPRDRDMRKVISNWKEIVAQKTGLLWQRDFFDHRLRGDEGYEEKARYIRLNPVRAGLTSDPDSWPYVWPR